MPRPQPSAPSRLPSRRPTERRPTMPIKACLTGPWARVMHTQRHFRRKVHVHDTSPLLDPIMRTGASTDGGMSRSQRFTSQSGADRHVRRCMAKSSPAAPFRCLRRFCNASDTLFADRHPYDMRPCAPSPWRCGALSIHAFGDSVATDPCCRHVPSARQALVNPFARTDILRRSEGVHLACSAILSYLWQNPDPSTRTSPP